MYLNNVDKITKKFENPKKMCATGVGSKSARSKSALESSLVYISLPSFHSKVQKWLWPALKKQGGLVQILPILSEMLEHLAIDCDQACFTLIAS